MTVLTRPAPVASPLTVVARLFATLIAAVLFGIGWSAGAVVRIVLWSVTAVRLGFDDARRPGGS
jgi:hypothetical protein